MFWKSSESVQSQWYKWMWEFGEYKWESDGHRSDVRCYKAHCRTQSHYINLRWKPKVRITRPLHLQVFQQVLRKRIKQSTRQATRALKEKEEYEKALVWKRYAYADASARRDQSVHDLAIVDDEISNKRVRLTISNFE